MPIAVLAVLIVERASCSCRVNSCFPSLFRSRRELPQKFRIRVAAKVQERYMRNNCGEVESMRAEAQNLVEEIKQSVRLLRRHL
jgi:hypothetical protein